MRLTYKILSLFLILSLLSILSGCSEILNREYRSVSPHLEQLPQSEDQTDWVASSLSALKGYLKQLIRQRDETGRIMLNNYIGNIEKDIARAGYDIISEDPIAAYSVDYFSHDYMQLSNEVIYTVNYKPGRQESIREIPNLSGLSEEIEQAIRNYQTTLVFEVRYFDGNTDLQGFLRDAYYRMPDRAVGMPTLEYDLYPDRGYNRVVELTFSYPYNEKDTQDRITLVRRELEELLRELPPELENPDQALALFDLLNTTVEFGTKTPPGFDEGESGDALDNLYTAMVEKSAISAGFALAYKLLCDHVGIQCLLVTGMRANSVHYWNIIRLDGDWYHVDASADAQAGGTHDWFLKTDGEMSEVARWDIEQKCESVKYTYEILTQDPDNPDNPDNPNPTDAPPPEN